MNYGPYATGLGLGGAAYYGAKKGYGYFWPGKKPSTKRRRRARRGFTKKVKDIIDNKIETRYIDVALSSIVAVSGTSEITFLTPCAQGDDHDERSGDIIHLSGIQINGTILADATNTIASKCRLMVIRANTNVTGSLPAITEFLVSDSVNALRAIDDLHNHDFSVIFNKEYILPTTYGALSDALRPRLNVKCSKFWSTPKKCTYDADDVAVTAAERGHLFLVTMTDLATNEQPRFELNIRVHFKDN